ncbi:MAG TPA: sigma-70 family RNA polymerase sigma factor [Solirubrobacteraceae bacterium]|nr:sigma-70 family RNA polymerase sigma factor [Solirubrobacteraceae bacterium]
MGLEDSARKRRPEGGKAHGPSARPRRRNVSRPTRSTSAQHRKTAGPGAASASGFRARTALEPVDREITQAVLRAQAGDGDAVRVLYLRYKDNVYGYVLSFVRDHHEAEDITQHVFLKLVSVIHKYRAREVPFTSWLLRVARNVALDHMRQRRALPCDEVYDIGHESDQSADDLRRGLEQALGSLPEDQRKVIVLRQLVGLTPGEIAARMGRTEASIHGLHHRARRAVQRELMAIDCGPRSRAV